MITEERVAIIGDAEVKLTPLETIIVACLRAAPRMFMTHDRLLAHMYSGPDGGPEFDADNMRVHVHRARAKLEPHGITIEPVWGSGYRLIPVQQDRRRFGARARKV